MKQRDECDINLLEKLGLFVVLEKSDCSSLSRNPWRIYSTNTWGNPTETRGQPANHHPLKTPAEEARKAPNHNKIWFYFRFLAFRLGPVPQTKSHACWAYWTLSRNFRLNLKFYSIYRIYIYIFNIPLSVQYSTISTVLHARLRQKIVTLDLYILCMFRPSFRKL